ncbi:MAG: GDP-mannose 4,6-dehydratase [Pseudomonadales bacterium]|nr:GDP-mannose 4,6-dehydratase [Pseudomonadales bacterium]
MAVLVTGAAGFIGFHTCRFLLARGETVVGLDNINDYYDVTLKEARLAALAADEHAANFTFEKLDVQETQALDALFAKHGIDGVIHLAAQAGVRYSIENPRAYVDSNVVGFINILESCKKAGVRHLVYASSSSVYGNNQKVPYATEDNVDHPISIYAATKKSNELMAHVYSHLFDMPTTGLRFFTVYGPWGRPDMSPFIFASAIFEERTVKLFNYGNHSRDFTYIDDIVDGVIRTFDHPPAREGESAPYAVYNIGNHRPVNLRDYLAIFEDAIGKPANVELAPMQPGDVESTFADITPLQEKFGYQPATPVEVGVRKFIDWYRNYYNLP